MVELILIILLLVSLFGMGFILYRKIPTLVNLPETSQELFQVEEKVKEGSRKILATGKFSFDLFLQKILSKIRVLTLKTENQTGVWLEKLRKKRNNREKDDYWQELKSAKK